MSQHDQQIDAVLHALHHAEARPGMEDRLLATLRAADAEIEAPSGWQRRAGLLAGMHAWWFVAAALLLVSAGVLARHLGPSSNESSGEIARSTLLSGQGLQHAGSRRVVRDAAKYPADPLHAAAYRIAPRHEAEHRTERQTFVGTVQSAASGPPPPIPITQQEHLLLDMARHRPATLLAKVTEHALNAEFQQDKAAVTEFFAKPLPAPDDYYQDSVAPAPPSASSADQRTPSLETP